MLYISFWWLLCPIILYAIYFIFGCISIGSILLYSIILKKKFNKEYNGETNKFILFLNNFSSYFRNICIGLFILSLIIILLNNIFYNIRLSDKKEQLNILRNEQFLDKQNIIYFYKIISYDIESRTQYIQYYIFSNEKSEKIIEKTMVKINKKTYVKPLAIIELTKKEFLEKTKNILLEENWMY